MKSDEDYDLGIDTKQAVYEEDEVVHTSRSNTEDGFYDAHDSSGLLRKMRSSSTEPHSAPSSPREQPYVQLSSFAGLSSPALTSIGKEGSVVSSLSSLSDHDRHNSDPSLPEEEGPRTPRRRKRSAAVAVSPAEEQLVFSRLFAADFYPHRARSQAKGLFRDMRLVQELRNHEGPVWCMRFAPSGLYLASGGQDGKIFVYCIAANTEMMLLSSQQHRDKGSSSTSKESSDSYAPIDELAPDPAAPSSYVHAFFNPEPYRVYEGHSGDVIDLSWSKSCFILSASVDKTIRLWHVTRNDCLQYFRHPDIVTAVDFHPLHDRYFVSGCFDRKLRVWDIIPDGSVREWLQTNDTITAVAFTPDGATVAAGLIQGQVSFYEYDPLKYKTQMDCKNHGGRYKRGAKVTGIAFLPAASAAAKRLSGGASAASAGASAAPAAASSSSSAAAPSAAAAGTNSTRPGSGSMSSSSAAAAGASGGSSANANPDEQLQLQMLVSTNDNRLRLCKLEDYSLSVKYKGSRGLQGGRMAFKNKSMQIRAAFSEDGRHVICGADTGAVHVWQSQGQDSRWWQSAGRGVSRNSQSEAWENSLYPTTVALFAPLDSVHSYLTAQYDFLRFLSTQGTGISAAGAGAGAGCEDADLCSRIVVTADSEGIVRVYFRVSSSS